MKGVRRARAKALYQGLFGFPVSCRLPAKIEAELSQVRLTFLILAGSSDMSRHGTGDPNHKRSSLRYSLYPSTVLALTMTQILSKTFLHSSISQRSTVKASDFRLRTLCPEWRGDINTRAARNAIERAGSGGVKIHGMNGYSTFSIGGRGGVRSCWRGAGRPPLVPVVRGLPFSLLYAHSFLGCHPPKLYLFMLISFCGLFALLCQITLGTS